MADTFPYRHRSVSDRFFVISILDRAQVSFRLVGGLRILCDLLRDELSTDTQVPSSLLTNLILSLEAAICGNRKL